MILPFYKKLCPFIVFNFKFMSVVLNIDAHNLL